METKYPDIKTIMGMMNELIVYPYQRKNLVKNGPTIPSTGIQNPIQLISANAIGT